MPSGCISRTCPQGSLRQAVESLSNRMQDLHAIVRREPSGGWCLGPAGALAL